MRKKWGAHKFGCLKLLASLLAMTMFAVVCLPGSAVAHFLLNLNVRIIHVEHLDDGLRVYLRLPMPYLVANLVGPVQADGLPEPAPYTTNTREDGKLAHYLDARALRADPYGLGRLVADGHMFEAEGAPLQVSIEAVRAYPGSNQPPFATIDEARAAFQGDVYPENFPVTYVGDTVVDVILLYHGNGSVPSYRISSSLNPGLPGQEKTANLILDYYPGGVEVFRERGLLEQPITIARSSFAAAVTFIKEGVRHILEGLDHVLFVLCLALGAAKLSSLLWRATGFTIGHTVTLSFGFFGFVPSSAWFIPAVEMGIAISIIYAAMIAVRQRQGHEPPERTMFVITTGIGFLHGLGFSFVLQEILQVDAPNIWQSLLAFNIGVEVGQVLIILFAWPAFRLIASKSEKNWIITRWSVAAPCIAIALYWTVQRAFLVVQTF